MSILSLKFSPKHAIFLPLVFLLVFLPSGCQNKATRSGDTTNGSNRVTSPTSTTKFCDVAVTSGLHYQWTIPGKRPLNILQTVGNGCAFLDFDGDGNLDILLVGSKLALYCGDGKGHFADVTQVMGFDHFQGHFLGCAVGDYDNDGWDDVYISGYRCALLLHNSGGKGFTDVTQESGLKPQPWGTSCAWVESPPGSGKLDLFICNYADFGSDPQKYPQLCPDHGLLAGCAPRTYKAMKDALYRGDGKGHFADASAVSGIAAQSSGKGLGVCAAPLDATRLPFFAVADDEVPGDLLQPTQNGSVLHYKNIGTSSGMAFDRDGNIHGGMGIDWGDYDNDGRFDLIVTTYLGEAKSLYHNDDSLLFTDTSYSVGLGAATLPRLAFGCKFFDADNDGWLDLMIANGHIQDNAQQLDSGTTYRQPTQFFHSAKGRFLDGSSETGADLQRLIVGRGLAIGDYDNDGRVDALVVDSEGAPLLLHNESAPIGHWLRLKLVGTRSNRDGYGAVVRVTAQGIPQQTRLCHSDGSYLSSSDRRVHVGLGSATTATTVQIVWPSGTVDTLTNVTADQTVTVREGEKAGKPQ